MIKQVSMTTPPNSNVPPTPNVVMLDASPSKETPTDPIVSSQIKVPEGGEGLILGKKRKLTSSAWDHFTKQVVNGTTKAVCNYCLKKLSGESRNGTKHLHDHYKICLKRKCHEAKGSTQKKLVVEKTS